MLILLMAGLPPVLADENENTKEYVNETKQSSIRGRIVDKSGQTLPGATIFIESLHTGAISDINGFYTLANLPVGTYKIKISYVGYSPVELTITVPEGKTVERDVTLSEGIWPRRRTRWASATWCPPTRWASSPTPTSATP